MNSPKSFPSDDILERYLHLAREIVIRIDLVAAACYGHLNMTPPYAREYCYLQYRRICELIALGCLLLHGDLSNVQSQKTKKEWNAHNIMKILIRSHKHAFPQSVIVESDGKLSNYLANSKPNALTLDDFNNLYAECGEVLHRGTIKSLEEGGAIKKEDYDKIIEWSHKICDLLNQHIIARSSGRSMYLITLRTQDGGPSIEVLDFENELHTVNVMKRSLKI